MSIGAMTREEYDALPAINWSTLREMRRSPKHYMYHLNSPRPDTSRLALGRAAHTAVFETQRFLLDYVLWEDGDRRGKKWEAFREAHASKTILKRDEYLSCIDMAASVREHEVASGYLAKGRAELSITWTDPETGLLCKGRVDFLSGSRPSCLDLKTTNDLVRFGATSAKFGYHSQGAFYARGLAANGVTVPFRFIAVETAPPHDVAVFRLEGDALAAGDAECSELLSRVALCRMHNEWNGAYQHETELQLPAWYYADGEDDVNGLDLEINGQTIR